MKIACVRCEKIHPSFATRQYAFGYRNAPVLHRFSFRNRMLKNTPKHVLGYNYEDCMRSLRKNPPEFRYPAICIRVPKCTRFASFFVPEERDREVSEKCVSVLC